MSCKAQGSFLRQRLTGFRGVSKPRLRNPDLNGKSLGLGMTISGSLHCPGMEAGHEPLLVKPLGFGSSLLGSQPLVKNALRPPGTQPGTGSIFVRSRAALHISPKSELVSTPLCSPAIPMLLTTANHHFEKLSVPIGSPETHRELLKARN